MLLLLTNVSGRKKEGVVTVGVAYVFVFNMDEVGVSRRGLPKFSEILRRPREAEVNHCSIVNNLHILYFLIL